MGKTLFVLRTFNDIDHISPVIWKFIRKNETQVVLFHSSYNYKEDYRIEFLQKGGKLEIYQIPDLAFERNSCMLGSIKPRSVLKKIKTKLYLRKRDKESLIGKLYRRCFFDCSYEMEWLRNKNITASVFEWNSATGRGEVLERFFYASKSLGIPTFSIPHGCNIYLNSDIHEAYRKKMAKGQMPNFVSRNEFDYYVVQSKYHLEHMVRFGMNRSKINAWGSTRYFPEWQQINLKLCPKFKPTKSTADRLKVVFMLPHWNYNVFKQKTLNLLDELSKLSWIHLVIKDHTRGSVGLLPVDYQNKYDAVDNVEVNVDAHSPALIQWANAVINFGSSIGLEALLQDKALIHATYLDSNLTIFEVTKSALIANNNNEVISSLEALNKGSQIHIPKKNIEAIFRSIIYGGMNPHDVLEYYYDQIKSKRIII